tara:strand:- start:271 stop:447 length:177 start_codon:yes stop_codon:yes gene_type:complete
METINKIKESVFSFGLGVGRLVGHVLLFVFTGSPNGVNLDDVLSDISEDDIPSVWLDK